MKRLRSLLILTLLLPATMIISSATFAGGNLEATIFSYDGNDFVRTETSLIEEGESAANTKLDRDGAAYQALVNKRSHIGPATLFGQDYQARYAPLIDKDGQLIGAVFVGVPK